MNPWKPTRIFCTVHWHKKLIIPSRSCEQPRSFGSWCSQWQSIQTSSVCTTTRSSLAIYELKVSSKITFQDLTWPCHSSAAPVKFLQWILCLKNLRLPMKLRAINPKITPLSPCSLGLRRQNSNFTQLKALKVKSVATYKRIWSFPLEVYWCLWWTCTTNQYSQT